MKLLLSAQKYLEKSKLKKMDDFDDEPTTVEQQKTLKLKLLVGIALHPLDYAKHLMMMGFEPLPPVPCNWLGKRYYIYPNTFKYVRHIYSVDGILGCFRGILFKSSAICVYSTVSNYLDKKYPPPPLEESLYKKLKRNVLVKCICTLVSHPFQMIAVRCMAQFVGRETFYSEWNPFTNLERILGTEGLGGLFRGFWAKLIGEVMLVTTSIVIVHGIYRFTRDPKEVDDEDKSMVIYSTVVNFFCVSYFYPYNVVSTTMSVNGVGLKIGEPPYSPIYKTSFDCYDHLGYLNQLKRGSQLVYRWVPTIALSQDSVLKRA